MTEEEARTKWCPMVRFQIGPVNSSAWQGVAYTNRGAEFDPAACRCIASDCALWVEKTAFSEGGSLIIAGRCGLIK